MPLFNDAGQLRLVERMLLKEMDASGRILVRSLDRIHARTGVTYATVSEIARRLQQGYFQRAPFV